MTNRIQFNTASIVFPTWYFQEICLIAYKSALAGLRITSFSVNNITEKLRLVLVFYRFENCVNGQSTLLHIVKVGECTSQNLGKSWSPDDV